MTNETKGEHVAGCLMAIFSLLVTSPLWLVLLFALMQANEMPMWAWAAYWVYVPAHVFGVILAAVSRQLLSTKE